MHLKQHRLVLSIWLFLVDLLSFRGFLIFCLASRVVWQWLCFCLCFLGSFFVILLDAGQVREIVNLKQLLTQLVGFSPSISSQLSA